jgi:hypothetical protein
LMFLIIAAIIQLVYYDSFFDQFSLIENNLLTSCLILVGVLFVNFCIDYVSNIQTISLLKMAAVSGEIFETLLVFLADISLTLTTFTLIFPFGVVGSLTCHCVFPPRGIRVRPDKGRTDEASKVH